MSILTFLIAIGAGVAAHIFYFKRGEHHLYPFRYVQALLLAILVGVTMKTQYQHEPLGLALRSVVQHAWMFLAGLFTSLLTYRLLFNPLNSFPGPFFARVSKFNLTLRVTGMDSCYHLQKLHKKYGKFVRIGPNDLSVIDADGIQVISSQNSKCYKAPWYEQDLPHISMHTTRDRAFHDRRRRIWSPAFSDKSLRGYESRIQVYNDMLIRKLDENSNQPVNASKWFNLYSFDVMGDLGFGRSFDMLESGETHWAIALLSAGMDPLGLGIPVWFFRSLVAIPGLAQGYHKFIEFCGKALDDRMKLQGKTGKPDIIHYLVEQYNQSSNQKDALPLVQADSRLIIVAGSDTTAASLVYLFHWLAKKPELQSRLREELKGRKEAQDLKNCDLLNGIIDEALRLNPPVPSGVFRKTPSEGVHIGKTFIPGDTVIQMPHYVMGHDEDLYVSPEEFIPERFYSKTNLIKHKDAWGPFSTGPFGCIGKNLAYLEIRGLTAQIVNKFDVSFAPGEDGTDLLYKGRDHFTIGLPDLNLVFTPRKS